MKLVLAPMEGLTDPLMRDLLTSVGHYDWCVTEFIRVTDSLLPEHVFYTFCPELQNGGKTNSGTPVHVQFLGNDANRLAQNAARAAELGAPAIDLNFGCPAKTVNRHRGGAVLLDEPDVIYALVKAVRDAVPAHIPVSAKMRLGYLDENHTLDNALAIEAAGASWLTVHARTKSDGYKPPAYWEKLPAIQQAIGIPVIANGEIWTLEQAQRCLEISGCKDLMLGRGAVTRPDLVNRVRHNNDSQQLSWPELVQLQLDFLDGATKTEQGLVGRYKQWLGMLTQGYSEAELLWNDIKKIRDMDILRAALQQHCLKQ
ncbi:tRNA-dihydrouridine synthase C [Alkanindiges hydrocarboniclasticus]|uniref:tRNA-dihydrouridine(16) synthase n=1 Tax=Alkanindiges hydrocarboniclasticus TaxID=1907941 RepID=A0A1S8CXU3_9GAMM|nr:tRNA-dihydrouridine synthase [Alkanindiges hydrocarboniclasticus]ONG42161.1 tRNA-dihydrouridine synthase C [Alkanindiges hydrocarboniclasticus]